MQRNWAQSSAMDRYVYPHYDLCRHIFVVIKITWPARNRLWARLCLRLRPDENNNQCQIFASSNHNGYCMRLCETEAPCCLAGSRLQIDSDGRIRMHLFVIFFFVFFWTSASQRNTIHTKNQLIEMHKSFFDIFGPSLLNEVNILYVFDVS